jgi:hypothetical protein
VFARIWLPALAVGVALCVIAGFALNKKFQGISAGGLWFVVCLFVLALVDFIGGVRASRGAQRYVPLPVIYRVPHWLLPCLIPITFALGIFVGNEWW